MSEQKIALEYLERHADDLDRQIRDLDRQKEELADKRDAVRKAALLLRGEDNTPEVGAAPGVPQSVRPQPFAGSLRVIPHHVVKTLHFIATMLGRKKIKNVRINCRFYFA